MEMVEMYVRMDCKGCERTIRKAFSNKKGVESVDVDLAQNKVTVTGYVDRKKVLKAVRNTGKRAEFWVDHPYHPHNSLNPYASYSQAYPQALTSTYNYEKHGYNNIDERRNPYYGHSHSGRATNLFNDEDPNSCSIM